MTKFTKIVAGAVVAATIGLAPAVSFAQDKVVLRAVSFFPIIGINGRHASKYAELVNERLTDLNIEIDLLGGPEVIAYPDQPNAVRTGAIDLAFLSGSQYYNMFAINDYYSYTNLNPVERRAAGINDFLQPYFHDRMNVHAVGMYLYAVEGLLYFGKLNAEQEARMRAGDFKGFRMRGAASYAELYEALGIENFPIGIGDVYSALERGTIDGTGFVNLDVMSQSWDEVLKYRIDHYYNHGVGTAYINLDKWNSLTPEQQEGLQRVALEWERWSVQDGAAAVDVEYQEQIDAGIEMVDLGPEGAANLRKAAAEGSWANLKSHFPEIYAFVVPLEDPARDSFMPPLD